MYNEAAGHDTSKDTDSPAASAVTALLWNGQISLFYGNGPSPGAATLRHTYFVPGDGWHFEDFAARDFTASTISPTVVNGRPWVVFSDAGPDLTYGVYR